MNEPDVLSDVIELLRVQGAMMAKVRAHAPWGLKLPQNAGAAFHAVTSGSCWLRVQSRPPQELLPGDVVLLPRGTPHTVSSTATVVAQTWSRALKAQARSSSGEIVLHGAGASTHFVCASYAFDPAVRHPLFDVLPPVLVMSERDIPDEGPLASTLRLLRHEIAVNRAGNTAVVNRLIDILFVHMLRAWIAQQQHTGGSWLSALGDTTVAGALQLLHGEPAYAWSVEVLADRLNVSRATLARKFARLVGESPMSYLARWRMELAARQLRTSEHPVGVIASNVGYTSEFAFSRAFVRHQGEAPGRYRRAHQRANDA